MTTSHLNTSGASAETSARSKITADELIGLYYAQGPKLVWRIGRDVFDHVRHLHDDENHYLMSDGNPVGGLRTLLGHPIEIVEGCGITLITTGGNRE